MSSDGVVVDALPYIDTGYDDPGVRESALAMVEEECRRYRPTKNYLDHLPVLNATAFETKLMAQEFERIQSRQPMETLSMKRYELPPPAAGRLSEVSAWQDSIRNSMAQLEHQWVRSMNLELMLEYGIESWKSHLETLVSQLAKAQAKLQDLKKQIQDVNWQRKQAQTNAGEKLRTLEATWVLLVSKNYEIEQQCVELEKQLQHAQSRLLELKMREEQQKPLPTNQSAMNGQSVDSTMAEEQISEANTNGSEAERNTNESDTNGVEAETTTNEDDTNVSGADENTVEADAPDTISGDTVSNAVEVQQMVVDDDEQDQPMTSSPSPATDS